MIFLTDPDTTIDVAFDWSASIGNGVTLASAAHVVPTGLTKVSEDTDVANGKSTVRISGGTNGVLYIIEAKGTLSTGEVIVDRAPVRVVAG